MKNRRSFGTAALVGAGFPSPPPAASARRGGQARLQRLERSDCGQAMTELMVAIIIVILLLAGLIQIGQLANAHTRTMVTARSLAAQAAMADTYNQAGEATYIYNWQAGPDGQRYTRDDTPILVTNAVDGNLAIVNMANPVELAQFVTNTSLLTEGLSADSMDEFFLVTGYASEPCATLPAIRKLAYDRAMILLQSQACLVWTEGIY